MTIAKNDRIVPFDKHTNKLHCMVESCGPMIAKKVTKGYVIARDRFNDEWKFSLVAWKLKVIM